MGKKSKKKRSMSPFHSGIRTASLNQKNKCLVIKGLHNLGNTCYFNASIQCLVRSPFLTQLLSEKRQSSSILVRPDGDSVATLQIDLPNLKNIFTTSFLELSSVLINTQNNQSTSSAFQGGTINPRVLREALIERHPRFGGFGQQDSHELLRALLDCIKEEEIMRWRKGILLKLEVNPKDVSEKEKQIIKEWGRAASFATTVDRLFGGILISSLECCGCGTIRPTFEPFLDLSLPIAHSKTTVNKHEEAYFKKASKGSDKLKNAQKQRHRKTRKQRRRRHSRSYEFQSDQDNHYSQPVQVDQSSCESKLNDHDDIKDIQNQDNPNDNDDESSAFVTATNVDKNADQISVDELIIDPNKKTLSNEQIDTTISCTLNKIHLNDEKHDHIHDCTGGDNNGEVGNLFHESIIDVLESKDASLSSSGGSSADIEDSDDLDEKQNEFYSSNVMVNENIFVTNTTTNTTNVKQISINLDSINPISDLSNMEEIKQAIHYARYPLTNLVKSSNKLNSHNLDCTDTLEYCLNKYTSFERLTGPNQLQCNVCTKMKENNNFSTSNLSNQNMNNAIYQDVIKRDLIFKPPPLLTIHLKRFQQVGCHLQKSQRLVRFPVYLNLTPYCSVLSLFSSNRIMYRLYGVVEHLGRLSGGHYVAYVAVCKPATELKNDNNNNNNINDKKNNLSFDKFVQQFIGSLDRAPKWPLSVHDLIQRLHRCDPLQLLDPINAYSKNSDNHITIAPDTVTSLSTDQLEYTIENDNIDNNNNLKADDNRMWFHCSDNHINQVDLDAVLNCQPYILFYERVE